MSGAVVDLVIQGQAKEWESLASKRVPADTLLDVLLRVHISTDTGNLVRELSPGQRFRLHIQIKRACGSIEEGWELWRGRGDALQISLQDEERLCEFYKRDKDGKPREEPHVQTTVMAATLAQGQDIEIPFQVIALSDFDGCEQTRIYLTIQSARVDETKAGRVRSWGPPNSYPQSWITLLSRTPDSHVSRSGAVAGIGVDLERDPVPDAAWLRVRHAGAERLQIRGDHPRASVLLETVSKPRIHLAGSIAAQKPKHPELILTKMRKYTRSELPKVVAWLNQVRELAHAEPRDWCVVIDDKTNAEVPWEMIQVAKHRFLGSEAVIVRWFDVGICGGHSRPLEQGELIVAGDTIHFVDRTADTASAERDALRACRNQGMASLAALVNRLAGDCSEVALVYVGSDGVFVDARRPEERDLQLQCRITGCTVRSSALEDQVEMENRDERKLPLVFVNACNSGRMTWQVNQKEGHGWPDLFLSRVARAYVGTLGEVTEPEAERIGARLIRAARAAQDGLAVAEFLTEVRREATEELRALLAQKAKPNADEARLNAGNPSLDADDSKLKADEAEYNEVWVRWLNSFMYVYYGGPRIKLRLRSQ